MIIQQFPSGPPVQLGIPPHLSSATPVGDAVQAVRDGSAALPAQDVVAISPAWQWMLAKNNKVADGLNILSTTAEVTTAGSDMAPMVMPFADGLAFSASGLSLAIKVKEGDHWGAAAAGIKLTGTALSLAENYFFPGNTMLTSAAGMLKISGMVVDIVAPEKSKAG